MNSDRIKEIQQNTAYPESVSVKQALDTVWNETAREYQEICSKYELLLVLVAREEGVPDQLRNAIKTAIEPKKTWVDKIGELRALAFPVSEWIKLHHDPHVSVVVSVGDAEVLRGESRVTF